MSANHTTHSSGSDQHRVHHRSTRSSSLGQVQHRDHRLQRGHTIEFDSGCIMPHTCIIQSGDVGTLKALWLLGSLQLDMLALASWWLSHLVLTPKLSCCV
jgi:hypothetical protein